MPKICPRYAQNMPKKCLRYAQDMPNICPRYIKDMPKKCPRYTQDMPEIAQDMPKICQKYAQDIPKICQRNKQKKLRQNVHYFYKRWGKMFLGKCPWGKMSVGQNVLGAKYPPACEIKVLGGRRMLRKVQHTFWPILPSLLPIYAFLVYFYRSK